MKKRVLPLLLVCGVMVCQPVMAMEQMGYAEIDVSVGIMPRVSDYIRDFDGDVSHLGNGLLEINASMSAFDTDKLEIKAQVQEYSGGKWSNYGAATTVSARNSSITMDRQKSVPDGKYRIKFTFNAYVGGEVVESKTLTTTSVTVKN